MSGDRQQDRTNHDDMVDMAITGMVVTIALHGLKAATVEGFRDDLERRRELREQLSAPDWMPKPIKPYYNIGTWRGRTAFFVGELSVRSPFNWYRYPVLRKLAHWSFDVDCRPRWELHEDWPESEI